jgi:hypothetical protein
MVATLKKTVKFYQQLIVFLILILKYSGLTQDKQFHVDSIGELKQVTATKTAGDVIVSFLKGIAASNYTKPTLIEIIPTTAKETVQIPVPVANFRPRLITSKQLDNARRNIYREPYQNWYELIKERVDRYVEGAPPVLMQPVYIQAEDIKNLAFVYQIEGDIGYLLAAENLLKQLPEAPEIFNLEGGRAKAGWGDFLQSAQAVPEICVANDLIYEDMNPDLRSEVRRKLLNVTAQLMDAVIYTPANNHLTVFSVAILVNALYEEHPHDFIAFTRQEMWITGLEALSRGLGLAIPDGGYAEGVYYARFILNYLAPLSVYFQNNTGEKLFEHPNLERMVSWVNANDKGSGHYSAFDDAYQVEFFFLPLVIPQSRQGNNWYAHWATRPPETRALKNLAEAICVFEKFPEVPATTQSPVAIYPETGQIIMRDDALKPQIFGSFISEREEWFASRHEHIDPMSFEISAFGEDFIIDAGYGEGTGSSNREWYLSAQAHNGLFKNGLGTNLNPIWGDPISSTFDHAFATQNSAAVSMKHYLGDTELNRKIYFLKKQYFVIYDYFKGDKKYDPGLNFNYLGQMQQITPNQLRILGKSSQLNILSLNSQNTKPIITDNFGLYTPPGQPQPMRTLQLEYPVVGDAYYLTIIYPLEDAGHISNMVYAPISGKGSAFTIRGSKSLEEILLTLNYGDTLKTSRFKSDANIAVVEITGVNQISSLLLVNFTSFETPFLSLHTDYSVTLYLEYHDFYWQGYIETEDELMTYHLGISGIEECPFRFNRFYAKPVMQKELRSIYQLTGSGTVDIGHGPAVQIPYRYHRPPDFLRWFSQRYNYSCQYELWSDYQRNMLNNQIARELENGFAQAINYWTEKFFPGTDLIINSGNVAFGLLKSSYSSGSRSTYTPHLPHRYQYSMDSEDIQLDVYEDGVFSTDFLRVRNFHFNIHRPQGPGLSYRGANWFEDHQMHRFRLYTAGGSQMFYQYSSAERSENHHLQMTYQSQKYALNPGYKWNNINNDNDLFLNWYLSRYSGSFRHYQASGEDLFYQSLAGYGKSWAFSLEGKQMSSPITSYQNYYGDFFLNLSRYLMLAEGVNLLYQSGWKLPFTYSEINWVTRRRGIRGRLQKQSSDWYQQIAFYWNMNRLRWTGGVSLENMQFEKQNLLYLKWHHQSQRSISSYFHLKYGYRPVPGSYGLELYQTIQLPAGKGWYYQPILGESIPSQNIFQWVGGGVSYLGKSLFYSQILFNYLLDPIQVDYQISLNIDNHRNGLEYLIWFQLRQFGREVYSTEIRIQKTNQLVQPGLYYSYLKDGEGRFEGYLEWHW